MFPLYQLWAYLDVNVVTVCLVFTLCTLYFWPKIFEKYRYPPGPIPLPFIGNDYIMFVGNKGRYIYENWKRYGNAVSYVTFGGWAVELLGYDAIYEAFVTHADHFSARTMIPSVRPLIGPGLIFGDNWKELRRQALMVFRDHGMGKIAIENKIMEEQECLMDVMATLKGSQDSREFKLIMGNAVSNVINQMVFGHRLEYDDPDLEGLRYFETYFLTEIKSSLIPFYKYLPWDPFGLTQMRACYNQMRALFRSEIEKHKESLDVDQPRDYIDSFLAEGVKTGNPIFSNEEELYASITQLFIAGFDTTSTTLTWALLYLINYPQHQQMIYEEIQQTIGNRPVNWNDRDAMNFTQAFIHEVLRASGIASRAVTHLCTTDTVIQGHTIPKGTRIMANLYSTYHDEDVFPDSYSFKPERFLDEQGIFIRPTGKQMLPFGIGKRACLGEGLARTKVFMFLVSLVQKFEAKSIGAAKLSEAGVDTLMHAPKPFEFNLTKRM